jgi:hypothetical protein
MLRRRRFKYNLLLEECLAKRLRICARNRGGFRLPIGETPCLNEHARTNRFAPGRVADISGFQTAPDSRRVPTPLSQKPCLFATSTAICSENGRARRHRAPDGRTSSMPGCGGTDTATRVGRPCVTCSASRCWAISWPRASTSSEYLGSMRRPRPDRHNRQPK